MRKREGGERGDIRLERLFFERSKMALGERKGRVGSRFLLSCRNSLSRREEKRSRRGRARKEEGLGEQREEVEEREQRRRWRLSVGRAVRRREGRCRRGREEAKEACREVRESRKTDSRSRGRS